MTLPSGTVTFLRSDIVGSMELAQALGARYDELNAHHAGLVRQAVAEHGGAVVRTEGDAFFVVFTEAGAAARSAVAIQRALAEHPWPAGHELRVRIGLHTGAAVRAGDDYGGFEVSRAARIAAVGHGGQIVLSDPTRALLAADLPAGWRIDELGRVRLKGVPEPERLFGLTTTGLSTEFPALRQRIDAAAHLPQRTSTFVGREAELAELERLRQDSRLLTLTGPGGTGKTTLAIELARRHADDYADGTWFIDLQAVRDPSRVRDEIARAVGLFDSPGGAAADRLMDYVADREMLIVLDNFEQVMDAADVVGALLAAAPRTRVLVTSRIPLRHGEEQQYPVRPLGLEAAGSDAPADAVRLFIERVRRVRHDVRLDTDDADVAAICRTLDGLPLAIELTAARAAVLPIPLIRSRLEQRLELPGWGPRDLPERQRTMEATVAWSYELLDEPLRRLLWRAAVFAESFELEQAELVCGPNEELGIDVLQGLFELTERSLLERMDDPVGGVRFRMLLTIHRWAEERLAASGEEDLLRERHAAACAVLAEREFGDSFFPRQATSLERLDADQANLAAATRHLIDVDDPARAMTLIADLWRYWLGTGRLRDALAWAEAAMALAGDRLDEVTLARAHDAIGSLYWWSGDLDGAVTHYEAQLRVARGSGRDDLVGAAWYNLAFARKVQGDAEAAGAALDEAERIFTALADDRRLAQGISSRAFIISTRIGAAERVPTLRRVVDQLEGLTDVWARANWSMAKAELAQIEGDTVAALTHAIEGYRLAASIRDYGDVVVGLLPMAMSLLQADEAETAALMVGAFEGAAERLGIVSPPSIADLTGIDEPIKLFETVLGSDRFEALVAEGRRLTLEETLDALEDGLAEHRHNMGLAPSSGSEPS